MKNKGITLIALVITIVILLILAGISINLTLGNNGILKNAINSKEKTVVSNEEENIKLSYASCKMGSDTVSATDLQQELDNVKKDTEVSDYSDNMLQVKYNQTGHVYIVNNIGEVFTIESINKPVLAYFNNNRSETTLCFETACGEIKSAQLDNSQLDVWKKVDLSKSNSVYKNLSGCNVKDAVFLDSNGKVYTQGSNYYGKLGIGNTDDSYIGETPICISDIETNALFGKKVIKVEYNHSIGSTFYAITDEGKVYVWGKEDNNIGNGVEGDVRTPICINDETATTCLKNVPISDIWMNDEVLAQAYDGKIYSWRLSIFGNWFRERTQKLSSLLNNRRR